MAAVSDALLQMTGGLIELIPSSIQGKVAKHTQDILVSRLTSAVKRRELLKEAGIDAQKQSIAKAIEGATPKQLLDLARLSDVKLTLTDEDLHPYLRKLGYKALPGMDYLVGSASLRNVYADPALAQATREAFRHNLRTTYGLYTNPSSPIYRRIVGEETDPVKIQKLIQKEKDRMAAFYTRYNESIRKGVDEDVFDVDRLFGIRGPLSRTTAPTPEDLTATHMMESTGDQYRTRNFPASLTSELGVKQGTHYGAPSIDDANAVLLAEQSWREDPKLLSSTGKLIKAPSYVRAIADRAARYLYPQRGMVMPSVADSNFVYTGMGMKPFGPKPGSRALTDNQDLYNMFMEDIEEVGKEFGYLVPSDFQAVIWAPGRELFEGSSGNVAFLDRPLNLTQEAADLLRRDNPDPRGYRDLMQKAAEKAYEEELAVKGPTKEVLAKRQRQLNKFEKINRSNPRLMALAALMAGGAGTVGLAGGGDDQAGLDALGRML